MLLGIIRYKEEESESASIVPMAFPLIAGAGTLTAMLWLCAEYQVENIIVAIIVNTIFVYVVLKTPKRINKVLEKRVKRNP